MSLLALFVVVLLAALICWALTLVPGISPHARLMLQMLVVVVTIVYVVSAVFGGGPVIRVG